MDVLNKILQKSAIGQFAPWLRYIVVFIFLTILLTLISMLAVLMFQGPHMNISFGY